ncbi:hypothetical protein NA57DRAFT_71036 [Rhizodiscina lignyota]|uniref:VWFA domain-containing protein n=1 Tax=Rhizodiscina lignyota TaxID=1504668 RepID=A0A9P4MBN1_9PEZI|nr:hypothetical protein NA57DRAFT_71036 [Rhizodiscina lignyota]
MGLASKLAASQGGAPSAPYGGAAPQQYPPGPPQGQKPGAGGYPGQPAYQAYPAQALQPGHSQQQSQYPGQPSPQPYGQGYNQPSSSPQPYGQNYNRPAPPPPGSAYPNQQYAPQQQQQFGYQAPQSQYSPQPQGYGGQPSYQSPPPQFGYGQGGPPQGAQGYAPQGAPGQYPPQGQPTAGGYGSAPSGGPSQPPSAYKNLLLQFIQREGLGHIYPPNHPLLDQIASTAGPKIDQICQKWRMPKEVGNDVLQLGLYDIILYIDDSGSMQFEEGGERIQDLRVTLERVAYAATLFDEDGISVRFMNSQPPQQLIDNIRSEQQIAQLMQSVQFRGLTPMGTELRRKIVDPLVLSKARAGQLRKPVLVIMITDGQPGGEPKDAVNETVKYASREMSRTQFGPKGIAFQFAQVGKDKAAQAFLNKLDEDPEVGNLIDCVSDYETEQEEASRSAQPIDLTPELYLMKLLLGAVDSTYDSKDERRARHAGAGGGGGYSAPGGFGAPPGYGAAPQTGQPGYGAPPQSQGYGQPGYGAPPQSQGYGQQGYPPQGGAGRGFPPQQGSYAPQGQGYPGSGRGY